MLQILTYIQIEQSAAVVPLDPDITIDRSSIFYFTCFEELEINKSVEDITQTARIKLPKRFTMNQFKSFSSDNRGINLTDGNYIVYSDLGQNENIIKSVDYNNYGNSFVKNADAINYADVDQTTGLDNQPIFNRGDQITIYTGYLIDQPIVGDQGIASPIKLYQQFKGYIASVSAGENIELYCEDFTWYFKQLRIPNHHYNTDPALTGSGIMISYDGLDSIVVKNANNVYTKNPIPNSKSNPTQYSINSLNGILLDCLNNALNYNNLETKGIYPLIWKQSLPLKNGKIDTNNGVVPKPCIVLADQPIRSAGNIHLYNNPSLFTLLELIKESFNMSVYFLQQSPALNMGFLKNLPYHSFYGDNSYAGYAGNYLNLGFSQYVPQSIYQPQSYQFNLSGADCNVITSDLKWKRQEDFVVGATIKSFQMADADDNAEQSSTSFGSTKKKIKGSNVIVGDLGGSMVTYYYSNSIAFDKSTGLLTGSAKTDQKLTSGSLYDMAKFGLEKLSEIHYTGYTGTITIFGYPFINIGDIANIIDPLYPERNGFYKVKKVAMIGNLQVGIQQEISLHYQVQLDSSGQYQILQNNSNTTVYYNKNTYTI